MSEKKTINLPQDVLGRAIQVGGSILEEDVTGTPVISPKTISAILKLTTPASALVLVVKSDKAFRFGSNVTLDGTGTGKGYKLAIADKDVRIPVATAPAIWLLADAFPAVFDFFYEILEV